MKNRDGVLEKGEFLQLGVREVALRLWMMGTLACIYGLHLIFHDGCLAFRLLVVDYRLSTCWEHIRT